MILRDRKLPVLPFALFLVVIMTAGWMFYHWHQTRYAKNTTALNLQQPDSQLLDSRTERSTAASPQIKAWVFSSHSKPLQYPPADNDNSISKIDQNAVEMDDEIYSTITRAIRNDFAELNLSQSELLDLVETMVQLRDALGNLKNAERTAESFSTFRQLEDTRDKAIRDFERITGMSVQEFLLRAPTDGGLDNEKFDDEEIILEPLSNYQP
jgi:hypothetical protein